MEKQKLSFFEMTVGLAFDYFANEKVDIAIIEVGLGGRLESTNIITPEIAVITNIGLDHTQFLGNTLELVAKEKAGIIKADVPVIIGETQVKTKPIFDKIASEMQSEIFYADTLISAAYQSDLLGSYQTKNIKTGIQSIEILRTLDWKVSDKHIANGVLNVVKNTGLKGRWQVLRDAPKVICDTAHNAEGLVYVLAQLLKEQYENLHIVLGVVNDKDLDSIIELFPKKAIYYFCRPNIPRGKPANALADYFQAKGCNGQAYNSVNEAYIQALKDSDFRDLIFVGGSTFVVAEII